VTAYASAVPRHTLGSLLIAGVAATWGVIGIIVRELDMPALAIVSYRVTLAAAAIAVGLLVAGRRDLFRLPSPAVLGLGVLLALHWSLYFAAIKETSVASAVLITYAGPIFMALIAPPILGEHVPRVTWLALGISLAGIALITLAGGDGEDSVRATGVGLAVLAAISFALLIVFLKRFAADVDPITVVLYENAVAAIVLSPAAVLGDYELGGTEIGYLLLLSVVLTAGSGIVYVAALRWVPATTAGILAYMEPVSAAILAAAILGESLGPGVIAGGAAIVGAGVLVVLKTPNPTPAPVT
jgi:drug/metabolite transporter (DMT)-like permease